MLLRDDFKKGVCIYRERKDGVKQHGVVLKENIHKHMYKVLFLNEDNNQYYMDTKELYIPVLANNCELAVEPNFCSIANLYEIMNHYLDEDNLLRLIGFQMYDHKDEEISTVFMYLKVKNKYIEIAIPSESLFKFDNYHVPFIAIFESDQLKNLHLNKDGKYFTLNSGNEGRVHLKNLKNSSDSVLSNLFFMDMVGLGVYGVLLVSETEENISMIVDFSLDKQIESGLYVNGDCVEYTCLSNFIYLAQKFEEWYL